MKGSRENHVCCKPHTLLLTWKKGDGVEKFLAVTLAFRGPLFFSAESGFETAAASASHG